MSQPLPTGRFHWVQFDEGKDLKSIVNELAKCEDCGYLLEVDVAYPRKLHDYHNDLPFMCAKMKINGVEKLVPILQTKISNTHQSFETSYRSWIGSRGNT